MLTNLTRPTAAAASRRTTPRTYAARGTRYGHADTARHVIDTHLCHHSLSVVASPDAESNICHQALVCYVVNTHFEHSLFNLDGIL
jgi:hypothetical protein